MVRIRTISATNSDTFLRGIFVLKNTPNGINKYLEAFKKPLRVLKNTIGSVKNYHTVIPMVFFNTLKGFLNASRY